MLAGHHHPLLTVAALLICSVVSVVANSQQQPPPADISDGLDGAQTATSAASCYSHDANESMSPGRELIYFVVLDAGSSGTRAVAHRFQRSRTGQFGFEHLGFSRHKRKPGLSAFRHFPWKCRRQLESLLAEVAGAVPKQRRAGTCLMLRATAGFRLMDARSRYLVAREIRGVLARSEFLAPTLEAVRMLHGSDEAKYTWLSVNYVLGNFNAGRQTKPVIEMGGGSVQVAYESSDGGESLSASRKLRLHARSYLGLGIRESVLRFVGHGNDDDDDNDSDKDLSKQQQQRDSYRTTCLAENLTLDFTFGAANVQLNGTRSPEGGVECLTRARDLVAQLGVLAEPALQLPANWPVYAISGMFHLLQFLHRSGGGGAVRFNDTACPGRESCQAYSTSVGELAEAAGLVCRDIPTEGPYQPYYCINLALTAAMLQPDGGMSLPAEATLIALGNQDALGWTLGFSLERLREAAAAAAAAATAAADSVARPSMLGTLVVVASLASIALLTQRIVM